VASLNLARSLTSTVDLTTDKDGNFYLLAKINQIYKFSPQGQLLRIIGAGTNLGNNSTNKDGSEPLHTVAVDSSGIFTLQRGAILAAL
jgi:hypothetical protein